MVIVVIEELRLDNIRTEVIVDMTSTMDYFGREPVTDDMRCMLDDMRKVGDLEVDKRHRRVTKLYKEVAARIEREMARYALDAISGLSSAYSSASHAAATSMRTLQNATVRGGK